MEQCTIKYGQWVWSSALRFPRLNSSLASYIRIPFVSMYASLEEKLKIRPSVSLQFGESQGRFLSQGVFIAFSEPVVRNLKSIELKIAKFFAECAECTQARRYSANSSQTNWNYGWESTFLIWPKSFSPEYVSFA